MRPKVTVYITCHNYGKFVEEAIDSVYSQLFDDWELLIIDDGSEDDSWEIIEQKSSQLLGKVRIFKNEQAKGLPFCANLAIKEARGKYLVRLDADDIFDESALLTMSVYLDNNQDVALVYPNYILVDEYGVFIAVEQRKKVGTEAKLMDLTAHGACTMVRKRVLKAVGGYSLEHRAQDGHDLWYKIINRYKIGNINTPLFQYRQHGSSLTKNIDRVLQARRKIKRRANENHVGEVGVRVVCVIPARNNGFDMPGICLEKIAGKPLIEYTIEAALECSSISHILLTSDDQKVLDHCEKYQDILKNLRPLNLSQKQIRMIEVMNEANHQLEKKYNLFADVFVMMNVHAPLVKSGNIEEAIDTLLLYDIDSVTSVYEDYELHFTHGEFGLQPLNKGAMNQLQLERESLYVDNHAIKVFWADLLSGNNLFGQSLGHVVMPYEQSYLLTENHNRDIIEKYFT